MNEASVGSILLVGERAEEKGLLVGIFTERDVLRHFELLAMEGILEKPVRAIMTKKVQTLCMSELSQASEKMMQGGFRHLPIVEGKTGNAARTLLGVISMRDLLKSQALRSDSKTFTEEQGASRREQQILLQSKDLSVKSLLSKLVSSLEKSGWSFRVRTPHQGVLVSPDFIVLDLDEKSPEVWSSEVKEHLKNPGLHLILVFDPAKHDLKVKGILEKLQNAGSTLSVFAKPMDVIHLAGVLTARSS